MPVNADLSALPRDHALFVVPAPQTHHSERSTLSQRFGQSAHLPENPLTRRQAQTDRPQQPPRPQNSELPPKKRHAPNPLPQQQQSVAPSYHKDDATLEALMRQCDDLRTINFRDMDVSPTMLRLFVARFPNILILEMPPHLRAALPHPIIQPLHLPSPEPHLHRPEDLDQELRTSPKEVVRSVFIDGFRLTQTQLLALLEHFPNIANIRFGPTLMYSREQMHFFDRLPPSFNNDILLWMGQNCPEIKLLVLTGTGVTYGGVQAFLLANKNQGVLLNIIGAPLISRSEAIALQKAFPESILF